MVFSSRARRAAEYDLCVLRSHYAHSWLMGQEAVAPGFSLIKQAGPYAVETDLLPKKLDGYDDTLLSEATGLYYRVELISDGNKPLAVSSVNRVEGK